MLEDRIFWRELSKNVYTMYFKGVLRDQQFFSQQSDVDKRHGLFRRQMFLAEDTESCLHTDVKSKEFSIF